MVISERPRGDRRRDPNGRARFAVLTAFVVMLFLIGGGSRSDVASTIVIRPVAALLCAYALTVATRDDIRRLRMPLGLLAGLALYHGVQLVPLPPGAWHSLPGHAVVAANDRLIGLAHAWRPISLSPSQTWNGLASLVVPAAAMLLMAIQRGRHSANIVLVLIGIAFLSACLGLLQLGSGADAPLYPYRITNRGSSVGLFANSNHHAFFLDATIVLAAWYFASARSIPGGAPGRQAIGLGVVASCAIVAMACGTRTGFLLMIVALIASYALTLLSRRAAAPHQHRVRPTRIRVVWTRYVPPALLALAGVLIALFYEHVPALTRLATGNTAADLRFQVWPTLLRMAWTYMPFGSGLGSFEHVFKVVEADAILSPSNLNQAHDDLVQVVIEAGLPGLALLVAALVGYARRVPAAWRAVRTPDRVAETWLPATGLVAIGILVLASATDYPLRTPSLMGFAAILVALVLVPTAVSPRRERH